jgi:hypothetical protein
MIRDKRSVNSEEKLKTTWFLILHRNKVPSSPRIREEFSQNYI